MLACLCQNVFKMIQSQQLCSSFKLIIFFTFSSLFKTVDLEQFDKFSEV